MTYDYVKSFNPFGKKPKPKRTTVPKKKTVRGTSSGSSVRNNGRKKKSTGSVGTKDSINKVPKKSHVFKKKKGTTGSSSTSNSSGRVGRNRSNAPKVQHETPEASFNVKRRMKGKATKEQVVDDDPLNSSSNKSMTSKKPKPKKSTRTQKKKVENFYDLSDSEGKKEDDGFEENTHDSEENDHDSDDSAEVKGEEKSDNIDDTPKISIDEHLEKMFSSKTKYEEKIEILKSEVEGKAGEVEEIQEMLKLTKREKKKAEKDMKAEFGKAERAWEKKEEKYVKKWQTLKAQNVGLEKDLEEKNDELEKAMSSLKNLQSTYRDLFEEAKKLEESYEDTHSELDGVYEKHRIVTKDMKKLIVEYEILMEKLKAQQPGQILFCHDSDRESDLHYKYTKKMTDYLFHAKAPLQGDLDFTQFQTCQYTPRLIAQNPDTRYEVLLYFVMASGGRHADPLNKNLFADLKQRSEKVILIACRNKREMGVLEDMNNEVEILKNVPILNFLMAKCEVQQNEHNVDVLTRIHTKLPPPPKEPDTWYEKYKAVDSRKIVKKTRVFKPKFPQQKKKKTTSSRGVRRNKK